MEFITSENYLQYEIGSKAERLFRIAEKGICVPEFFCIKPDNLSRRELDEYLERKFGKDTVFSVRSSASAEDGEDFSFAGQFETYLSVPQERVYEYAVKCFESAKSVNVAEYCRSSGTDIKSIILTVIIQKMIYPEYSGVIFTANPQGILNEAVIAAGCGTGNNIVEDKVPVTQYFYNLSDKKYYYETQQDSPLLKPAEVSELIETALKIQELFGCYSDIEFAMKNSEIYILQARPITSINKENPQIILDSSNISESYPGISSPLTISFVKEVYYLVFRSCVKRLTRNDGTAERLDDILRNMTDSANGRIYYRISGWYDVINLLPFSRKIIPVWQEMLGVDNKSVSLSAGKARFSTKLRVTFSFFEYIIINRRKMSELNVYFNEVYEKYSTLIENTDDSKKLIQLYSELENALASKWDLTLVNDMYSFIFTGLLKSFLKRTNPENFAEITNECISGIANIESMKPVKMLEELIKTAVSENAAGELELIKNKSDFLRYIQKQSSTANLMLEYITLYGDRCAEELKLETRTFRTNPELLAEYVSKSAENFIPSETSEKKRTELKGIKKFFARRAADGISLREQSRLSRGKIFGLVRSIILKIADNFTECGILEKSEDIFYLTLEEIFQTVQNNSAELKTVISERRRLYDKFGLLPAYRRLVFSGKVYDKSPLNAGCEKVSSEGGIYGIPCSGGIAEGEAVVVKEPSAAGDVKGKIIIAEMTDPGWVFLLTQAKGIVSQRGSLLSHTAIISRELGKPSIVGADNICSIVKSGDRIKINGNTGKIEIL